MMEVTPLINMVLIIVIIIKPTVNLYCISQVDIPNKTIINKHRKDIVKKWLLSFFTNCFDKIIPKIGTILLNVVKKIACSSFIRKLSFKITGIQVVKPERTNEKITAATHIETIITIKRLECLFVVFFRANYT